MQYFAGAQPFTPAAQEFVAVAPANPFAVDWAPTDVQLRGQAPVYRPTNMIPPSWWSLCVEPRGEIYFLGPPTDDEIPLRIREAQSSPNHNSMLKFEVKYQLGNGHIRTLRADVRSGVDIWIGPTVAMEARLLVPVPSSASIIPPDFDRSVWLASSVIFAAKCVPDPLDLSTGTYSQAFYSFGDLFIPSIPVQTGAKRVQVVADAALNSVEQVWQRRDPSGAIVDEVVVGDVAPIFAGAASTIDAKLSGLANVIRVRGGTTGTVVQSLQF